MVSGEGMNPAMLCCRKKMKVTATISATRPPAVTSQGRARRDRSTARENATERTVLNTGEYQAQPRRTPLNPRAAPATATATAVAIAQGLAPGPSGRDAAPGERTAGSSAPEGVPGPGLRCGARVMAGPPRRG